MTSHINLYARVKRNDKPPHLLFSRLYGNEAAEMHSLTYIKANNIHLSSTL